MTNEIQSALNTLTTALASLESQLSTALAQRDTALAAAADWQQKYDTLNTRINEAQGEPVPRTYKVTFLNAMTNPDRIGYATPTDPLAHLQQNGYPDARTAPDDQYAVVVTALAKPEPVIFMVKQFSEDGTTWGDPYPMSFEFVEV